MNIEKALKNLFQRELPNCTIDVEDQQNSLIDSNDLCIKFEVEDLFTIINNEDREKIISVLSTFFDQLYIQYSTYAYIKFMGIITNYCSSYRCFEDNLDD
jgi:hypothetical protein